MDNGQVYRAFACIASRGNNRLGKLFSHKMNENILEHGIKGTFNCTIGDVSFNNRVQVVIRPTRSNVVALIT